MPIVADLVDAVIGADTHRDTHTLEMCSPSGVTLATITVPNTDAGFTDVLTWVAEHAPGPQIAAGVEGTRSYGIGLSRVLSAAGMRVIEVEQPQTIAYPIALRIMIGNLNSIAYQFIFVSVSRHKGC